MKWIGVVVFCVLGVCVLGSDVVQLTDDNFDEQTNTGTWFLEFFAPWCGHCKKLAPSWEKLATELKGEVNVASIDCTVQTNLAQKFGIKGYPTIKFLKDGMVHEYTGGRVVAAFLEYASEGYKTAEKKPLKAPKKVKTGEEIDELDVVVLDGDNFYDVVGTGEWIVEFYAPWCGFCKRLIPTWSELATSLKGKTGVAKVDVTDSSNRALGRQFDIKGFPTIKFFKDGKYYNYAGDRSLENLKLFVAKGYAKTEPNAVPYQLKLLNSIFDGLIDGVRPFSEPYEDWILEHVGTIIISMTIFGLVVGCMIGRISKTAQYVYVQQPPKRTTKKNKKED